MSSDLINQEFPSDEGEDWDFASEPNTREKHQEPEQYGELADNGVASGAAHEGDEDDEEEKEEDGEEDDEEEDDKDKNVVWLCIRRLTQSLHY